MLVIDASVAVKWVLPEPDSDRAVALRDAGEDLAAPSIVLAEVGNALWKSALRGDITKSDAVRAWTAAARHLTDIMPLEALGERAVALSIELRQPIYDCFYLALAERENAAIVTADERMFAAARKARIKVRRL